MKTAISIPDAIFDDAERLVARLRTSRSELYSRAIAEFVARHDADRVTEAIDRAIGEIGIDEDTTVPVLAKSTRVLRQVEW